MASKHKDRITLGIILGIPIIVSVIMGFIGLVVNPYLEERKLAIEECNKYGADFMGWYGEGAILCKHQYKK